MSITSDAGTTTAPLPLTTTFTPPSACLSDLWFVQSSNGKWMNLGPANTTQCLPSGYTASNTYTSGVCPRGWVMASNLTTEVSNQMQTVGTCCPQYLPSGWVFSTRPPVLEGASEPWYSTEVCQFAPKTTIYYGYTWMSDGTTSSAPSEMTPGGLINAYGIIVEWHSDVSSGSATSTPTETALVSTSASRSGLKIGIGVGVAVGGTALLTLLVFFILRRGKRTGKRTGTSRVVELDISPNDRLESKHEVDSNLLHEADTRDVTPIRAPVELDGNT